MNNWQDIPSGESTMVKEGSNEVIQFIYKVLKNWYWILLSAAFFTALGFLYIRYKTPIYQITAKILVNDEQKSPGLAGAGDMLDFSSLLGAKNSVDNEVEILKTRYLMEQVVRDLNANVTYYNKGRVNSVELKDTPLILRMLNVQDSIRTTQFDVNISNNKVLLTNDDYKKEVEFGVPFILENIGKVKIDRNIAVPITHTAYMIEIASFDSKVAQFMDKLKVSVTNKLVSTVDLNFEYAVPKKGEDILSALIKNYVQQNIYDKNIIADSTIAFIEDRLVYVSSELGNIEGNIQKFKQANKVADITEQSKLLLSNSSQYIDQLSKIETQLSILTSLELYLKEESKNKRVLPSAVLPDDMVFSGLIDRYNTLLLERDRQSLSATDNNPQVQNLDQQISNLRKDMLSNLLSTKHSLTISRDELRQRSGQLAGQIRQVPATERTYLDLARQQQIKQELYLFLLQKREETAISKTSNISNSKVIDPPKSNFLPFSPNRKVILMISFLMGIVFPLIIFYIRELLDTRINSKADIEQRTSVPIIGEISNSSSVDSLIVNSDPRSPIAEQFRALRTNLQFFLKSKDEKVLLFTSSMSGEGKSFVSVNLGLALAISGKKVALMEMDLRKPTLSSKFNVPNDFGATNYLISDNVKVEDIIKSLDVNPNISLISSGPIPPNPAEVILNEKLDTLIEELKERFDFIIIDAPPIGLVTDAQLLSKFADLTLYLVRQGFTYKEQLRIPESLLVNKRMNSMALLVNDIKTTGAYGYGYGYGYGGYGEYETKRKSWFASK